MWCCKFIIETSRKEIKKMDIVRSRDFSLPKILQYLTRYCLSFDEVGFARHKKHEILKPLESDLKEEDYKLNWNDDLETTMVADFMSMIRKVPVSCSWKHNRGFRVNMGGNDDKSPGDINQIHVDYDRYLQNSIKESEWAHTSVISVNLKSFWSSASNEHQFQVASRKFLQNKSFLKEIDVIFSGYMVDIYGVSPWGRIVAGVVIEDPELCFSTEQADSGIIPHIAEACQEEVKTVVFVPNNTSVVIYSLPYHQRFYELGIQERWVKFGIEDERRNIPIHKVRKQLGGEKSSTLLKVYTVTGCDETSKIGIKAPAVASKSESYLDNFGFESLRDSSFVCAKKYLVRVISSKPNCKAFNNLKYEMFKNELWMNFHLHQAPFMDICCGAIILCNYPQTFWTAAVKYLSLQILMDHWKWTVRNLPYHQTSRQSVVVRKNVQRIVDVGGHSLHGVLRLYKWRERIGFWN